MSVPHYAAALIDPFARAAEGAQVPDEFSLATTINTIRTSYTLSAMTPGNGGTGNDIDFVVLPSLVTSIVTSSATDIQGSNVIHAGATYTDVDGHVLSYGNQDFNVVSYTATPTEGFLPTKPNSNLAAAYQTYRVVGFGVRLFNRTATQYCQGQVYAAEFPAGGDTLPPSNGTPMTYPDFLDFVDSPLVDEVVDSNGDTDQYVTSNIVVLPGSLDRAAASFQGGMMWVGKVITPQAFCWRCPFNNCGISKVAGSTNLNSAQGFASVGGGDGAAYAASGDVSDGLVTFKNTVNVLSYGAGSTALLTTASYSQVPFPSSVVGYVSSIAAGIATITTGLNAYPFAVGQTLFCLYYVFGGVLSASNFPVVELGGTGYTIDVSSLTTLPAVGTQFTANALTFLTECDTAQSVLTSSVAVAATEQTAVQVVTSAGTGNLVSPDYVKMGGFSGLACRITGLQNATLSVPASTFELEVTYLLEGMVPCGSNADNNSNFNNAFRSAANKPPVDRQMLDYSIELADSFPCWKKTYLLDRQ
jgi:hypothetical protein